MNATFGESQGGNCTVEHLRSLAGCLVVTTTGAAFMTILAGPFLSFLGFGLAGVQAGSWAAAIHATLGNIAAGSTFATAQSAGAGGAGMAIIKWALMKGYLGLNSGCIVALGLAKENCTLSS